MKVLTDRKINLSKQNKSTESCAIEYGDRINFRGNDIQITYTHTQNRPTASRHLHCFADERNDSMWSGVIVLKTRNFYFARGEKNTNFVPILN